MEIEFIVEFFKRFLNENGIENHIVIKIEEQTLFYIYNFIPFYKINFYQSICSKYS